MNILQNSLSWFGKLLGVTGPTIPAVQSQKGAANMGGFLGNLGFSGIVNLFSTLWPVVNTLIQVAESTNSKASSGADKFQQVMGQVQNVALTLPAVTASVQASGKAIADATHTGDLAALSNGIGDMINLAVRVANSVGAFQKSGFVQAVTAQQAAAIPVAPIVPVAVPVAPVAPVVPPAA